MVINYSFKHNVLLSHTLSFFQCLNFWGYSFGKHTLNFLLRCVYCAEHSSKKNILQLLVWKCKRNLLFIFFNNSDEARMCFEWSSKKDADFQCNNDVVKRNNLQFFKIWALVAENMTTKNAYFNKFIFNLSNHEIQIAIFDLKRSFYLIVSFRFTYHREKGVIHSVCGQQ